MQFTLSVMAAASMAALANAHGYFVTPKGRVPGTTFQDECGMQAYYNMEGSINGNIQGLEQVVQGQTDYHPDECNLWKCKGLKYQDNIANVQKYTPGQVVDLYFDIVAPHTGTANVSIIKTETNKILTANLKQWDVYASNSVPTVDSQEHFSVTMPTNLGTECATQGDCAIQMHWNAADINQTYQSCIDFTLSASTKRSVGVLRAHAREFNFEE